MEILKVEHLKKTYGDGKTKVEALKNINISVERGQMVAITGPSGCGKSTLLNLISGIDKPTSGEVIVEGSYISNLSENKLALYRRRQLGIIYQFEEDENTQEASITVIGIFGIEKNQNREYIIQTTPEQLNHIKNLQKILDEQTNIFVKKLSLQRKS